MAPLPEDQQPDRDAGRPRGTGPPSGADGRSGPLEQPASSMPPQQEDQPAPTFPRWMYGVGAAVVVFAAVWVLLNVL